MEELFSILALVAAIVAYRRVGKLRGELTQLRAEIAQLRPAAGATPAAMPAPVASSQAPLPAPGPEPGPLPQVTIAAPASELPVAAVARTTFEEQFTVRWAVWLGGATIALGAVFLVKYSIDQGWVGPELRTALGVVLGLALVALGEFARGTSHGWVAAARANQAYVPAALAGAGLTAMFASIYVAYEFYELLPPLPAFVLLSGVAFGAFVLSLRQGPLIAVLGLVAAYAVPALVASDQPSAITLFAYLAVVAAACMALVRYCEWWWLAGVALGGAVFWPLVWMASTWQAGDAIVVGGFALVIDALFGVTLSGWREVPAPGEVPRPTPVPHLIAWLSSGAAALIAFAVVRMDSYSASALAVLIGAALLDLVLGRRDETFDRRPWIGATAALLAILGWHLANIVPADTLIGVIGGQPLAVIPGPWLPPGADRFVAWASALAVVFAIGALAILPGATRPVRWAVTAATAPLLMLAVVYARIVEFELALPWAAAGLALAATDLAIAAWLARRRAAPGFEQALGVFAIAVVGATGLAMAMALREAWLTVALAALLPAMAWVDSKIVLPGVRPVALAVASIVAVRLLLNPSILDYPLGAMPLLNWLLYGYGLPALGFYWSARVFRARRDDALVMVLEAGALIFVVVMVWFEIRALVGGAINRGGYGLTEQSLQSLAWLTMAYALLLLDGRGRSHPVRRLGWRILAGLATVQVAVGLLLLPLPGGGGEDVGASPVFNRLLLAAGLPAVFAALIGREAHRQGYRALAGFAGLAGLVLGLSYLTLEVRRGFHGTDLLTGETGDAEWYVYSAVWLVYGAVLLAVAIGRSNKALRHAALAVVTLTVAKVFLFDMSTLTGLLRAASFLGLGLSLVGIGWLYQRFVFPSRPADAGTDTISTR